MKKLKLTLLIPFACWCLSNIVACKTAPVINKPVIVDTAPSWDGNEQNSGIIEYVDGVGWRLTERAAKRYSILSEKYGSIFLPKLEKGEGLEPKDDGTYILKNEYMVKFILMTKKHKES
jgi:hypothetical protein